MFGRTLILSLLAFTLLTSGCHWHRRSMIRSGGYAAPVGEMGGCSCGYHGPAPVLPAQP